MTQCWMISYNGFDVPPILRRFYKRERERERDSKRLFLNEVEYNTLTFIYHNLKCEDMMKMMMIIYLCIA